MIERKGIIKLLELDQESRKPWNTLKLIEVDVSSFGGRDRTCPSGVLLNVPAAAPSSVLAWRTLRRIYALSYHRKYEREVKYIYICMDDLIEASIKAGSAPRSRGFRSVEELQPLIQAFAILLSKSIRTVKPTSFWTRRRLVPMIVSSVNEAVKRWISEVERGEAGGDN